MKILVTGAAGQLGRDCLRCFAEKHECLGYTSARLDITDAAVIRNILRRERPQAVVNCAAYTAVDRCESEEARCLEVNAIGPGLLATECAEIGCRLVHVSTDYVFDGNKPVPEAYLETDPTNPLCAYGRAKLQGERAVAQKLNNHLIVRTAWLYGIDGHNFLKTILRLALNREVPRLKIVNDQFGSLTWTWRLATQLEPLLTSPLTGIVHATAEQYCTWYQAATAFLELLGIEKDITPCSTDEYPTPAHRPANSILENRRLKEAGCHLMLSWQEDLRLFVRQHSKRLLAEAMA